MTESADFVQAGPNRSNLEGSGESDWIEGNLLDL